MTKQAEHLMTCTGCEIESPYFSWVENGMRCPSCRPKQQATTDTIVQDYRSYTAEEILRGILEFAESSGWTDPANLGGWLGAAQRRKANAE